MRKLLEDPRIYALWQAPFVRQKVAPFLRHNRVETLRRVLDVGCGPGTNAPLFAGTRYLGVDLDDSYVAQATRRYGPHFRQGDAAALAVSDFSPVDCLFINSLTHHLDDDSLANLLRRTDLVSAGGALHIIDLYLPSGGLPRWLAQADRGDYPRPLDVLRQQVERSWQIGVCETFSLSVLGLSLWSMVYIRATPRGS